MLPGLGPSVETNATRYSLATCVVRPETVIEELGPLWSADFMTSTVGAGAGTNPVPERDTACTVPFWASLVRVNAPVRDPPVVGANTTLTTQFPPGATDDAQLLD